MDFVKMLVLRFYRKYLREFFKRILNKLCEYAIRTQWYKTFDVRNLRIFVIS